MLDYQQRVVDERKELQERKKKLATFIYINDEYETLPEEEKSLLERQLWAMVDYSDVLKKRIDLFNKREEKTDGL